MEAYLTYAERQIDKISRRVLQGETISLFGHSRKFGSPETSKIWTPAFAGVSSFQASLQRQQSKSVGFLVQRVAVDFCNKAS
jgi:hypothetical protein